MNLQDLIDKLEIFKQNLENPDQVEILISEQLFSQGAVITHVRKSVDTDLQFENNLQEKDLYFVEPEVQQGIILGFLPRYV